MLNMIVYLLCIKDTRLKLMDVSNLWPSVYFWSTTIWLHNIYIIRDGIAMVTASCWRWHINQLSVWNMWCDKLNANQLNAYYSTTRTVNYRLKVLSQVIYCQLNILYICIALYHIFSNNKNADLCVFIYGQSCIK